MPSSQPNKKTPLAIGVVLLHCICIALLFSPTIDSDNNRLLLFSLTALSYLVIPIGKYLQKRWDLSRSWLIGYMVAVWLTIIAYILIVSIL